MTFCSESLDTREELSPEQVWTGLDRSRIEYQENLAPDTMSRVMSGPAFLSGKRRRETLVHSLTSLIHVPYIVKRGLTDPLRFWTE